VDEFVLRSALRMIFVEELLAVALVHGGVFGGEEVARAVRPWRRAFCEDRALPSGVRGPVEYSTLARLIRARIGGFVVAIVGFGHGDALARVWWLRTDWFLEVVEAMARIRLVVV
jgi:hypothetical protein